MGVASDLMRCFVKYSISATGIISLGLVMRHFFISISIFTLILSGCRSDKGAQGDSTDEMTVPSGQTQSDSTPKHEYNSIEFMVYRTDTVTGVGVSGWAYDIFVDGKRMIHQPHIPAVAGRHTFRTQEEAERVAALVSFKIRNNIMPPSVTTSELDSLRVSYE
jgi:hypothetical protein